MADSHANGRKVRVGAMADLHCSKNSHGWLEPLLAQAAQRCDLLLLAGDLTDYGLPQEADVLVHALAGVKIPVVAVLGNHDYESDQAGAVKQILIEAGVTMLDGDACEIQGVGIAGVKGFGGGFGNGTLGAWGEEVVKKFVNEAVNEALRLESALARLRTAQRIALLHYAPIEETVQGEPREIFPFLGCGRLAEPLTRYPVAAVFHGHAHRGSPEGHVGAVPVYNVALPLMRRLYGDQSPLRIVELEFADSPAGNGAVPMSSIQRVIIPESTPQG